MTGIASRAQLRMSLLRYALVAVPAVLLLGTLSGRLASCLAFSTRAFQRSKAGPRVGAVVGPRASVVDALPEEGLGTA